MFFFESLIPALVACLRGIEKVWYENNSISSNVLIFLLFNLNLLFFCFFSVIMSDKGDPLIASEPPADETKKGYIGEVLQYGFKIRHILI